VICTVCGSPNESGRKFCGECGTALSRNCPACGAPNAPGVKFCGECGSVLATAGPGTATASGPDQPLIPKAAVPVAERRLVSVLFADLVGFTALSEGRDAEEVRELLTRYFETCRRLVGLYGGTIEKFIGDAVMAVWGTPVAQEDDGERAVRTALDLVAAVAELGKEVGAPDLAARAGVLTGEAAVTLGATGQGMVAGDLVNTASRIQSVAQPGSVLVGEVTRRATEASIVYADAGTHVLKGRAEPVSLWRAIRVVAGRGGNQRSTGLEPPFSGRHRELRVVKDLFHDTAQERRTHLVSVIGVAGLGKSRLTWEFEKYIDGLADTILWHRGRCLSYGEGVAYWALAEMVRMRARIVEGEEPASAMAKLRGSVEEYLADPDERRFVEPRLAHLLGLEERTASDPEDLFSAWRLFFERLSDRSPTVLVFEDLHWADAALLDFIEYLLEWSRDHALYVLTLARPDLLDRRPNWGGGKRNFTQISLEPLAPRAMGELLSGLVPGLPDEVLTKILDRAEGVPLYAVETVRMLLDRGLLEQEGNAYRPTASIEDLAVPETLQALVAARLDGLTPDERRMVQNASVLGKTFTEQALASVSSPGTEREGDPAAGSDGEVANVLTSLVRKEILTIQADPLSPERGQYGFLQDLLKQVAYETLSKRDRKARHLAVATYLEDRWGADDEEIVEVVASHYVQAYRAAPDAPDAPSIRAKARESLTRAGERAASLAALEEAERSFSRAAELADDPAEKAPLLERAGMAAWRAARGDQAMAHYREAVALFETAGLTHPAARVSARMGEVDASQLKLKEGILRMEQAFSVLEGDPPDEDLATLAAQLGRLHWLQGDMQQAARRIEVALDVSEKLRLVRVLPDAMISLANVRSYEGRPEEGLALLRHALDFALEHDISAAALRAYNNLGYTLQTRDRYSEVLETYERGVELARRVGERPWELVMLAAAVFPLVATGRWDEAIARTEDLRQSGEVHGVEFAADELLASTVVYVERGEVAEAEEIIRGFSRSRDTAGVQSRAAYAWSNARLLRASGHPAEAVGAAQVGLEARAELGWSHSEVKECFVQAIEAALAIPDVAGARELLDLAETAVPADRTPYLDAQVARCSARLVSATGGDPARIVSGFKQAAGLFDELGMPFNRAVTLLEHAEWVIAAGRGVDAEPFLTEARERFEHLRARPWVERAIRAEATGARSKAPSGQPVP
jgi:class 3 adenylate cyclase/tetratricopeptide (TPR) repeat protein